MGSAEGAPTLVKVDDTLFDRAEFPKKKLNTMVSDF